MPPSSNQDPRLRWSGHTDRGRVRKNNEDSFLGLQFDAREVHYLGKLGEGSLAARDVVFAVSDGMGGEKSGEFASRVTVEKITHVLPRAFQQTATGTAQGADEVLGELFEQIHRELLLLGRSYEECAGMGATLTLCWFTPRAMHFAHIGDTRLYYLPAAGTGLMQLTHDDTYVGWLFRNRKINEREARNHPGRHSLQKALGAANQFVEPQVGTVIYEPGDRFLLCSDGLVDGYFDEKIGELMAQWPPGPNPAEQLVSDAVQLSGRDNTTALVIEVL